MGRRLQEFGNRWIWERDHIVNPPRDRWTDYYNKAAYWFIGLSIGLLVIKMVIDLH